jgi:hypothetical protein
MTVSGPSKFVVVGNVGRVRAVQHGEVAVVAALSAITGGVPGPRLDVLPATYTPSSLILLASSRPASAATAACCEFRSAACCFSAAFGDA